MKGKLAQLRENLKKSFNMLGYFVEAGSSVLDREEELKEFEEFFGKEENQLKEVSRSIEIARQNILLNISRKKFMDLYLREFFEWGVCWRVHCGRFAYFDFVAEE